MYLQELGWRAWAGLMWFRMTGVGFHTMRGTSGQAEDPLACQEVLCCMQLVNHKLLYYFAAVGRLAALYSRRVFDSLSIFGAFEFHLDALPSPRVTSRVAELVL
jgi:hypothetical protein